MELKENMKVLFRGMALSGGAPKSIYQHLKILKHDGHRISVIIQQGEPALGEAYKSEFDSLTLWPDVVTLFKQRSFIKVYRQLCLEYRALKAEKPDLVLGFGCAYPFFYSGFGRELSIPCIMVIAGGDLTNNELFLDNGEWCHTICFSEENREVLLRHMDDKDISVIANRIELKTQFDGLYEHLSSARQGIRILLTSRITANKIESIKGFINNLCLASDTGVKINLSIAGGGDRLGELKEYVSALDCPGVNIELKGHLDDLVPEFERAHLVVGKGRSVLEPVMMNRPGCVIGDGGEIALCTSRDFEQLYRYNFSGRGLACDDPVGVLRAVLTSLEGNTLDVDDVLITSRLAREHYSSEYLREKLYAALKKADYNPKKSVHIPIALQLMKFALLRLRQKLNNKKKRCGLK